MKMEQTECSETSTYKIQTLGKYSEENIQQNVWTLLWIHICCYIYYCEYMWLSEG